MAAGISHPSFPQPDDPSAKVWRYLDFVKFVSLLETSGLFFSRADLLGDPFEGSYPKKAVEERNTWLASVDHGEDVTLSHIVRVLPKWVYINCWHLNPQESAAMWQRYTAAHAAIAIQTSYERLANCLPQTKELYIGCVTYIDYETDRFDGDNILNPFLHKRRSFIHEQEVRAVLWDSEDMFQRGNPGVAQSVDHAPGMIIPVELDNLIEAVFIAPGAPNWLHDLVQNVARRYGQTWEIHDSTLDASPVF